MAGNDYPGERREAVVPGKGKADDRLARGAMKPPAWLDPKAKKLFREYAEELNRSGLLRRVDLGILAEYCQAQADVARLTIEIRKTGGEIYKGPNGGDVHNPRLGLLKDARRRLKEALKELGCSPKSRTTLKFPAGGGGLLTQEEQDQMELFMAGKSWNRPDQPHTGTGA